MDRVSSNRELRDERSRWRLGERRVTAKPDSQTTLVATRWPHWSQRIPTFFLAYVRHGDSPETP